MEKDYLVEVLVRYRLRLPVKAKDIGLARLEAGYRVPIPKRAYDVDVEALHVEYQPSLDDAAPQHNLSDELSMELARELDE